MTALIQILSTPVSNLYDDSVNEIDQAFNYKPELEYNKNNYGLKQIVRLILIIALTLTCIQTYLYIDYLIQFSYMQIACLCLTNIAITLTFISLKPDYEPYKLLRKWTHTLNSCLFFIYVWQSVMYWMYLYPFFQSKRRESSQEFMIELNQRILWMPHICLILNYFMTDYILLNQHNWFIMKIYALYQLSVYLYKYRNNMVEAIMYGFKFEGTAEIITFSLFMIAFYIPQWVLVKISQYEKQRKIVYTKVEAKDNAERKHKKK